MTYGAEIWRFPKDLDRKLRSAQRGMERKRLHITWRDRNRASWIREQMQVEDNMWTTKITERQPRNCRRQGRQGTRWKDEIRAFARAGWSTLTPDRGPGGEMRLEHLPGQDGAH